MLKTPDMTKKPFLMKNIKEERIIEIIYLKES